MPRHKRKKRAAATKATAGVKRTDWLVGDLVVAKLRGHRPWPAQIQKPEDFGYEARPHRIFITFFGTDETCFCSYNKITPFTGAVRKSFAEQLQKINTNQELERAIKEIFAADDELKMSLRTTTTTTAHGSSRHKEDDMGEGSEKSEGEEKQQQKEKQQQEKKKKQQPQPPPPPAVVEGTRKRARAVEEEGVVGDAVDEISRRPAKQEKTTTAVKNMAVEAVQKLPRKVRIKVSSQSSDSPRSNPQQGGAPAGGGADGGDGETLPAASEKVSVSSSEPPSTEITPRPTSDSSAAVVTNSIVADKSGDDEPTSGKKADTTSSETTDNAIPKVSEVVPKHNTENGVDVKDNKVDKEEEKVDKMEVDGEARSPTKKESLPPPEAAKEVAKEVDDAESGVEKMEVDDAIDQKMDATASSAVAAKPSSEGAIGSTVSDKSVPVPVIGDASKKADGEDVKNRPDEDSSGAERQQCETAQPILKADALEERQVKEDEARPPSSNPETQTVSKAEEEVGSGLEGRDAASSKSPSDTAEEAATTKDSPVKVSVTSSPSGITAESKEDVKLKQDAAPVLGSAVHDAAKAEQVSVSGAVPSKEQDSISGAEPETGPASVPVSGQVTASKTTDKEVPSSEAAPPLSKGENTISGADAETGPASVPVSGQVTESEKADEKVASSVENAPSEKVISSTKDSSSLPGEAVPPIAAHGVSDSAEQNGPVSASVTEQDPVAAPKDEALLPKPVEDSGSGAKDEKEGSGPVQKDEPLSPASVKEVKEASDSEAQNQKESSVSVIEDNPLPLSLDKEVSESVAQDKKEGPVPVPTEAPPLPPPVKEVDVSPPDDQKEGSGTASKDEALVPPAGEEVSLSLVTGAHEKKEGLTSSVPEKEQVTENTVKSETVQPKSEKEQVSVAPSTEVETAPAAAKEEDKVVPTVAKV